MRYNISMDNLEKRDTLSMISHELRTSLVADKWVLKMLLDGDLGPVTDQQKIFLEKALKNNDKMVELITELVEAGHTTTSTKLSFEEVNMNQAIQDVLKDFEAEAKKRNIVLVFREEQTDPIIAEANKNKIHSAIQELVNNALKYTDKGSVTIRVSTSLHGTVLVRVEDTGIGIPESEHKKISEKFFRGESAKKKEEIGSGLGLFAVQKIAEKHGGKLFFTSEVGKGSIFTLEIPLKHPA